MSPDLILLPLGLNHILPYRIAADMPLSTTEGRVKKTWSFVEKIFIKSRHLYNWIKYTQEYLFDWTKLVVLKNCLQNIRRLVGAWNLFVYFNDKYINLFFNTEHSALCICSIALCILFSYIQHFDPRRLDPLAVSWMNSSTENGARICVESTAVCHRLAFNPTPTSQLVSTRLRRLRPVSTNID